MKLLLASLTLAMLIFTGCSQKNPNVDMTGKDGKSTEVSADKKADDLSGMDSTDTTSTDVVIDENAVAKAIAALETDVNKIYFDFDKYELRSDMEAKVKSNARLLNAMNAKDFSIKVEGNCDEWGTDEYNYALGLKRAKSVKASLASYGIDEQRIMIVSFGESNPECKESNKSCWDKNRRAEFKLLP
jgi:peptidoglycan-associated lipoprotein